MIQLLLYINHHHHCNQQHHHDHHNNHHKALGPVLGGLNLPAPRRAQLIYEDPEVEFHLYDEDEHCDDNDYEDPEVALIAMSS